MEIKTKLSQTEVWELQKLSMRRIWWAYVLFTAMFIFIGITSLPSSYGIIMIVFGVLFFPLCILLTKIMGKHANNSKLISNETVTMFKFEFDSDLFVIDQSKGENYRSVTQLNYSLLDRIYENKNNIFLFVSPMVSHIIPKKDIEPADIEKLTSYLKLKLDYKYIKYK